MRRRKLRKSDIIDELKTKKMNPLIPIVIFLSVVTILSIIIWPIYDVVVNILDIDVTAPIKNSTKPTQKPSSSKDKIELMVPKIENPTHDIEKSKFTFEDIKADKMGYILTISLLARNNYSTMEVKAINIDGFYIKTNFAISDRVDYAPTGEVLAEQIPTTIEFRIDTIELTELGIFGFNKMNFYYDYEENGEVLYDLSLSLIGSNSIVIVNERKGLIPIDSTKDLTISYYKTIEDNEYTYIYFDFKNKNAKNDYIIDVKSLEINGQVYRMNDFERKIYRGCEHAEYLQIPKSKFSKINSFKLSFFVSHRTSDGKVDYIHYTKEYVKTY